VSEKRVCADRKCGAEFEPDRPWQKFCSAECRHEEWVLARAEAAGRRPAEGPCANPKCAKEFERARPWQRFCSSDCKRAEWRARHLRRKPLKRAQMRVSESKRITRRIYTRKVVHVGSIASALRLLAQDRPEFFLRLAESVRKTEQAPVPVAIPIAELQPLDFPGPGHAAAGPWGGE
jgi:hypothetical protein